MRVERDDGRLGPASQRARSRAGARGGRRRTCRARPRARAAARARRGARATVIAPATVTATPRPDGRRAASSRRTMHPLRDRRPRPRTGRPRCAAGRQWPPSASAIARTYVPSSTRRSSVASGSSYRSSSSAWTVERRIGISTATPRRCRRYARSPPIFTADAAGIGSSTSPRSASSRASSSSRTAARALDHLALGVAGRRRRATRSISVT